MQPCLVMHLTLVSQLMECIQSLYVIIFTSCLRWTHPLGEMIVIYTTYFVVPYKYVVVRYTKQIKRIIHTGFVKYSTHVSQSLGLLRFNIFIRSPLDSRILLAS